MSYKEFKDNWEKFVELIDKIPAGNDEQINQMTQRYIEQNIMVLNDVFSTSIENLNRLKKAKSANDIICTQARFTNEITKKLTQSAQRFLNASLGHIADYNEWLKAHCDLATD